MEVQQIQKRMIISLAKVAKEMGIQEGDPIVLEPEEDGIFIRLVGFHNKKQDYFWNKEWQERMKNSLRDIETGKYRSHENMRAAVEDL